MLSFHCFLINILYIFPIQIWKHHYWTVFWTYTCGWVPDVLWWEDPEPSSGSGIHCSQCHYLCQSQPRSVCELVECCLLKETNNTTRSKQLFFFSQDTASTMLMGITKAALILCSTMKPTSLTSPRPTTVRERRLPNPIRTRNGRCCTAPPRLMVSPLCFPPISMGWCRPLSKTTKFSKSSGTSDTKDTCRSRARRPAKPQCSASCGAVAMMSWSSATS